MLKLRKQAIKEKTKAELAWIEQQKKMKRNKGADDNYPTQQKRKVLLRLQKEQVICEKTLFKKIFPQLFNYKQIW